MEHHINFDEIKNEIEYCNGCIKINDKIKQGNIRRLSSVRLHVHEIINSFNIIISNWFICCTHTTNVIITGGSILTNHFHDNGWTDQLIIYNSRQSSTLVEP